MNHLMATSKHPLSSRKVEEFLHDINQRRFKGLLTITGGKGSWGVGPISLWMETKRTLEIRPTGGSFFWWVATVFQNELAAKFQGYCKDEAKRGKREIPDTNLFPTLTSYFEDMIGRAVDPSSKEGQAEVQDALKRELVYAPSYARALV